MTKQSIRNLKNGLPRCARNDGFTLAEVLITLVIIGVIAAITVPTLIVKYQKEQTVVRLKKAYSSILQATQLAIANEGHIRTWQITQYEGTKFAEKYLIPYLDIAKNCKNSTTNDCIFKINWRNARYSTMNTNQYGRFYLNDGTFISIEVPDTKQVLVFIDINGTKKPNLMGKDIFLFFYNVNREKFNIRSQFVLNTFGYGFSGRNSDLNDTKNGCKTGDGYYCTQIIILDGWRIADDYPW